jgi:glycosyltransferase involved in cell wall biosynthesis
MNKIKKFIILYPSWERGGATVNLINFINYCIKKKIQIHLISNINKRDQKIFFIKGVNFTNIKDSKNNNIFKRLSTSMSSIFLLLGLWKKIKRQESIVLSFQSHIIPIIVCKFFNRKIIFRNSEDITSATKYADNKFSAYIVFILKIFTYNFANGIITNSIKAKRSLDLITINKNKTKLIYNPYLKKILVNKKTVKKNFILSVGRLCKQKNQIIIIKAFALFLKRFPKYKLILIGHGQDEFKLKKLCNDLNISKNVIFKGWVFNPKKYYLSSKILVFPSLYEGLPNTLIEAVNFGLPCISSRCSGATDILTNKYGLFVDPSNHILLANKMINSIFSYKQLLSNHKKIKKNLTNFLVKPQALKYLTYCNNILNENSK